MGGASRRPAPAAAERRDWWVASGWSAVLLVWLAGAVAWLEHYYVFSRQETSPVDGPLPDALAVLAVCVGASIVAVMAGRARRLAPAPVSVAADVRSEDRQRRRDGDVVPARGAGEHVVAERAHVP